MKKVAIVLASLLIAACSTTQQTASSLTAGDSAKSAQTNGSNVVTGAGLMKASVSAKNEKQAANKLVAEQQAVQNQSIYFDFDKSAVKPEFQDTMQKQASFIKKNKNEVVTLEGNADERGSNEYNLALGTERAAAVEKSLELLGVPAKQIKTVSFGEEKPRLVCHEEKCWKENRRVDFVLSGAASHPV